MYDGSLCCTVEILRTLQINYNGKKIIKRIFFKKTMPPPPKNHGDLKKKKKSIIFLMLFSNVEPYSLHLRKGGTQ